MKAKQLAEMLLEYPDHDVYIGYMENRYGEEIWLKKIFEEDHFYEFEDENITLLDGF